MLGPSRALATVLCAALIATPAFAEPPTSAQKQQAGDLVKRAIAKGQAADPLGAVDLYLQAYAILPEPMLLSDVGAAYQQANQAVLALKYFCKYLDADPTGTNASFAAAQAKQLQDTIGNHADDDRAPCAPPKPVAPPPVEPVVVTPVAPASVAPEVPDDDAHAGRAPRIVALVISGVGVVGLAIGAGYGWRARTLSNEITNHPMDLPWPDNIQSIQSDGHRDQSREIDLLIGGGALVAASAVIFVLARHSHAAPASETLSFAPVATPSAVGFVVGGGF